MQRAQDVNDTVVGESFNQNDWRLPNVKELASIAELRCSSPAINNTVFPEMAANAFWSSSPNRNRNEVIANRAWRFSFFNGSASLSFKSSNHSVRLVRSGQ